MAGSHVAQWLQPWAHALEAPGSIPSQNFGVFFHLRTLFCLSFFIHVTAGQLSTAFFIPKNRWRNCDAGWVLCHILMAFIWILFKPKKSLL